MFVDKYRPRSFEDTIGRNELIEKLKELIAKPETMPHLLFSGMPGTGKTLLAELLAKTVFGDSIDVCFYQFNASQDRGIDMVRNDIYNLAKTRPMGKIKIILMDEADAMTNDAQFALRRIMEQFGKQTKFIFTCNYRYKLIQPILSRLVEFELEAIPTKPLAMYLKKIVGIEKLQFSDEQLISFAKTSGGDVRRALNLLEGANKETSNSKVFPSFEDIKKMNKNDLVMLSFKGNPDDIFSEFWDLVKDNKAWQLIPFLADCQSKMNFSVHKTVFLCELMTKVYETYHK